MVEPEPSSPRVILTLEPDSPTASSGADMVLTEERIKETMDKSGPISLQELVRVFHEELNHPVHRATNRAALREIVDRIAMVEGGAGTAGSGNARLILREHASTSSIRHLGLQNEGESASAHDAKVFRAARLQRLLHPSSDGAARPKLQPYQRRWFRAAASGDVEEMRTISADHASAGGWRDGFTGYTAAHWAAKLGRADMLDVALAFGGDINAKSFGGYTPLHMAALSGQQSIYTLLCEKGADASALCNTGDTAAGLLPLPEVDAPTAGTPRRDTLLPPTPSGARVRTASMPLLMPRRSTRIMNWLGFGKQAAPPAPMQHSKSSPTVMEEPSPSEHLTGALVSPGRGGHVFVFSDSSSGGGGLAVSTDPSTPSIRRTVSRSMSLLRSRRRHDAPDEHSKA